MKVITSLRIILVTALILLAVTASAQNNTRRIQLSADYDSLISKAKKHQVVRVIASVKTTTNKPERAKFHKRERARLMSAMSKKNIHAVKQLRHLPFVVYEVTEHQLNELLDSGIVVGLVEE